MLVVLLSLVLRSEEDHVPTFGLLPYAPQLRLQRPSQGRKTRALISKRLFGAW